ncbi:MAG: C25 family cysteine peptidase, partial [Bacteroidota bacterium]
MRRILIIPILLLLGSLTTWAQYGNEWINYDQLYWKLKVVEDGLYRVTAGELAAQGFPVSQVSAENIKVYHNGEEVAVLVSPSTGALDQLEFYGVRNDGEIDAPLYTSAEAQPHQLYSLFTDTSTYFLTYEIAGTPGKRISLSTDNDNSGLVPDSFHWADTTNLQTTNYATGFQYGDQLLAQWDMGEGWTGPDLARGASVTYDLTLNDPVSTGPNPLLEMVMLGRNSLGHVVEISAGPDDSNLRVVATTDTMNFSNRTSLLLSTEIDWSDVSAGGELVVQADVLGRSGAQDRIAISYVQVAYPQDLDFDGGQEHMQLATSSGGRSYLRISAANPSAIRSFDITDPANVVRILANALSDRIEIVVNGTSSEKTLLLTEDLKTVSSIEGLAFEEIDLSTANYLILTHPDLRRADSVANADPVADYATYRRSEAGGSYDAVVANIQEVYDQFGYGVPTPLAVRNLVQMGFETGNLRSMFIVGRGRTVNSDFYRQRD